MITNLLPPTGRGGAERYVADLASSLAETTEVHVLTGTRGEISGRAAQVVIPSLLPLPKDAGAIAKASWHARDQFRPASFLSVYRALRTLRPDVVHTHELQGLSSAPFFAIAALGLAHVHTTHDWNLMCIQTSRTRNGTRCSTLCAPCKVQRFVRTHAVRRRLDFVISPSHYVADGHIHEGIFPSDKVVVINHGAQPPHRLRTRSQLTPPVTIGFIGALEPHKGVMTLLDAISALDSDWRLLVAGTGTLASQVARVARTDSRVRLIGYVDQVAKDDFYSAVDIIVIPSQCEEVATLVAAESLVRGIPLIVSDRGGLPETPASLVFPAGDASALAAALYAAISRSTSQRSRQELAIASRQYAWKTHVCAVASVLSRAAKLSATAR